MCSRDEEDEPIKHKQGCCGSKGSNIEYVRLMVLSSVVSKYDEFGGYTDVSKPSDLMAINFFVGRERGVGRTKTNINGHRNAF